MYFHESEFRTREIIKSCPNSNKFIIFMDRVEQFYSCEWKQLVEVTRIKRK